ncbi:hypothetical protein NH288_08470 [Anaerococcus sp. NML200537]|uniref:hypothetical protein n=1 Tax=Anaerococcus sp. NML200537 TaxID=2954485 RepID=UPI00223768AD|nr:hypothetical protein [Anaerococcus sp. NML200537]MCW6702121.1 hypothetical protein [Anaerococcus sp. NML200537]
MMFKAKIQDIDKLIKDTDFVRRGKEEGYIDENNYIYGYYIDGYIVGPVVDVGDDHIDLDYWCKVDPDTLVEVDSPEFTIEEWSTFRIRKTVEARNEGYAQLAFERWKDRSLPKEFKRMQRLSYEIEELEE